MGMGTRLYSLPGGDGDEIKLWYPLGLSMRMGMNFFCGDGYEIVKPVPVPPGPIAIPKYNNTRTPSIESKNRFIINPFL